MLLPVGAVTAKRLQTYGNNAAEFLRETIGDIYHDGTLINLSLVKAGLAWHYVKYAPDDTALREAEQQAREMNNGLWSSAHGAIPPWDWRNGVREETAEPVNAASTRTTDVTVYITASGKKYHDAGCRFLNKSSKPIPLSRAASKYGACKVCKPPAE
jgi:hypothetical protein